MLNSMAITCKIGFKSILFFFCSDISSYAGGLSVGRVFDCSTALLMMTVAYYTALHLLKERLITIELHTVT